MKYLFVANPMAGKGRTRKLIEKIKRFLISKNIDFELLETTGPNSINEIIKNTTQNFDRVIVIGGDGTIHELVNSEQIFNKVLGVLPTGSGNDFALTLGLRKNLYRNLEIILDEKTLEIDIGYAEITEFSGNKFSFLFANSLGIGFDAEVAARAKEIKFVRGLILYLISVFITLVKYKFRNLIVQSNSLKLSEPIFMISIGNGKTAGGGFKLTPSASPVDGELDICVVKKISKLKVLRILPLAIFGKHITNPSVYYFRSKEISITSDLPIYVHADGEIRSNDMKSIKIVLLNRQAKFLRDGISYVNETT
ncbi:MAG: diacylglycerol kinase family lipid kinase [Ignavibacteria bacterium]|nr:diacylglycerol kinase family lipid kinase [Ignavibacteria bacterium]